MSTLVSDVTAAFVTRLQASPAVSSNIGRTRQRPWPEDVSDAIVVRPLGADIDEGAAVLFGSDTWLVRVAVECYARAGQGTAPDAAVDTLLAAVYARVMGDETLNGALPDGVVPQSLQYDFDADGDQAATATLVFQARMTSGAIFN